LLPALASPQRLTEKTRCAHCSRALEVRISDALEHPGPVEDLAGDAAREMAAAPALLLRQAPRVLYAISTHMIGTNYDARKS
jgi:hypothetical protein